MTRAARRLRPEADVESALASLQSMRIADLRTTWTGWFGDDAPRCQSGDLLRRLMAWRLQEAKFGGLPADAKRRLKQFRGTGGGQSNQGASPLVLKPGTMITREWRGTIHRVHVLENGFVHEGKHFGSLSSIARKITGKRWSGPRFFGIEGDKGRPAAQNSTVEAQPR
jgi:hypothetical protein